MNLNIFFELTDQTEFDCSICAEKRFVSLELDCHATHKICAHCFINMGDTKGLNPACPICRKSFTLNLADNKAYFHKLSDLKPEEYLAAAMFTARENKIDIFKFIEEKGVNPSPNLKISPIYIAAQKGRTEILKHLADQQVDLNEQMKCNGSTPILIAAEGGHTATVKFLAEKRVDLNKASHDGCTPIFTAAAQGHIEIVKFLAKERVDLNIATQGGWTPIFGAARQGHTEIVKFLAEEVRVDLNKATDDGWTPIFAAAMQGHTEIVKFLVEEERVDLNIATQGGWTPIFGAAMQGHTEIVKFLAEEDRVDLNKATDDGWTPILIALEKMQTPTSFDLLHRHREIFEFLFVETDAIKPYFRLVKYQAKNCANLVIFSKYLIRPFVA